jgi:hypothetical protein
MVNSLERRGFLVAVLAAAGAGCASEPSPGAPAPRDDALVTHWRTVIGGFIGAPSDGLPARPTGMFVKLLRPGAVAVLGNDLLIADLGQARLWRADLASNTLVGIAGAPIWPQTALALGNDLSAWVLDTPDGRVLRFSREGRLMQTFSAGTALPMPSAIALADGGATLLTGDGPGAQWAEQRMVGGVAVFIPPSRPDGGRISGVDALALAPNGDLFVLDRLAGVVHRVRRDGLVLATLGRGELAAPAAIAVDRFERVFVVDTPDRSIKVLQAGKPTQRLDAATLRVQQIGGIATDGEFLVVSDSLAGQVVVHRLGAGP